MDEKQQNKPPTLAQQAVLVLQPEDAWIPVLGSDIRRPIAAFVVPVLGTGSAIDSPALLREAAKAFELLDFEGEVSGEFRSLVRNAAVETSESPLVCLHGSITDQALHVVAYFDGRSSVLSDWFPGDFRSIFHDLCLSSGTQADFSEMEALMRALIENEQETSTSCSADNNSVAEFLSFYSEAPHYAAIITRNPELLSHVRDRLQSSWPVPSYWADLNECESETLMQDQLSLIEWLSNNDVRPS